VHEHAQLDLRGLLCTGDRRAEWRREGERREGNGRAWYGTVGFNVPFNTL